LLDFGCGQGAAVEFFNRQGFQSFGVDISTTDLSVARARYPEIRSRFAKIDSKPDINDRFFDIDFDVIIAIQSLYYYSDEDLKIRMESIYKMLEPNGVFYATMMGTKNEQYYKNSDPYQDGLRQVNFETNRDLAVEDYYVNFTDSEDELMDKFDMFEPNNIGFYSAKWRSDELKGHHYTFVGTKSNYY
jgi:cyclopropane fatty-acyl-phospholipid synthase-like methyltransferase